MAEPLFHTVALLTAHADSIKKLKATLVAFVEPTREEPGCRRFEVFQDCVDPSRFALVADWVSEKAHLDHLGAPHTIETFKKVGPLLGGETELREYSSTS